MANTPIEIITNPQEMYRKADQLGLRYLLTKSAREIHALANQQPAEANFVINKKLSHNTGFAVIMIHCAGLFADALILFNADAVSGPGNPPSLATMDQIAQDFAQRMLQTFSNHPCTCDRCQQPANRN
jgi:hypothetical protein